MAKVHQLYSDHFYHKRASEEFERGLQFISDERPEKALDHFKTALKMDSQNGKYAYFCGLSIYLYDKEEAKNYFKLACELSPNEDSYKVWYGIVCYEMKFFDEAKRVFLYLYSASVDDERVLLYLTRTMNALREHGQVVDILKENIKTKHNSKLLFEWGFAHFKNVELEEAEQIFKLSIETHPDDKNAYYFLSRIYCKKGEFEEAIQILNDLLEKQPTEEKMIREQINAIELLRSF